MGNYKEKDGPTYKDIASGAERSRPITHQRAREIQPYGRIAKLPIALDEKRGLVYLPVTSPSNDYYGGERKGPGFRRLEHGLGDYAVKS